MLGKWSDIIGRLGVFAFLIRSWFVPCGLVWMWSVSQLNLQSWVSVRLRASSLSQDESCQCLFKALRTHCCGSFGGLAKASSRSEDEKDKRERGGTERKKGWEFTKTDECVCSQLSICRQHTQTTDQGLLPRLVVFSSCSFSLWFVTYSQQGCTGFKVLPEKF